eukprot:COSAG01_NODE_8061_length_2935_cov_31.857284_2_plen_91_part_00
MGSPLPGTETHGFWGRWQVTVLANGGKVGPRQRGEPRNLTKSSFRYAAPDIGGCSGDFIWGGGGYFLGWHGNAERGEIRVRGEMMGSHNC